jgi:PAS domain-containing protein
MGSRRLEIQDSNEGSRHPNISRASKRGAQAVYEPTDLATLTSYHASVFRSAIEHAGMQLNIDCPPLPEPVYVDRVIGVVSGDEDRILEANDAFLDILGVGREELEAGKLRWRAVTAPEYRDGDEGRMQELLATVSASHLRRSSSDETEGASRY